MVIEETPVFLNSVKKLKKDLVSANNELSSLKKVDKNVSSVFDTFSSLQSMVRSNPDLAPSLKSELNEKKLLSLFEKMNSDLKEIKLSLSSQSVSEDKVLSFVESFRDSSLFGFSSNKVALDFVESVFSNLNVSEFYFRPEFFDTINIKQLCDMFSFSRTSKGALIPVSDFSKLTTFLRLNNLFINFIIETNSFRLVFKSSNSIKVSTSTYNLKRISNVASSFDAVSSF